MRPAVGIAVIVMREGKILLGKRKGAHGEGMWAPPGGHLEFGESVKDCAYRELAEETGLKARSMKLGPWTENVLELGKKHYITLFVFVDQFDGEPKSLEPEKCLGWEWFEWNQLPSPIFPTVSSLFNKLRDESDFQALSF